MKCYNCSANNPSSAKFCSSCGTALKNELNYVEKSFKGKGVKCWNCSKIQAWDSDLKVRYKKNSQLYCPHCAVKLSIPVKVINAIKKVARNDKEKRILSHLW